MPMCPVWHFNEKEVEIFGYVGIIYCQSNRADQLDMEPCWGVVFANKFLCGKRWSRVIDLVAMSGVIGPDFRAEVSKPEVAASKWQPSPRRSSLSVDWFHLSDKPFIFSFIARFLWMDTFSLNCPPSNSFDFYYDSISLSLVGVESQVRLSRCR